MWHEAYHERFLALVDEYRDNLSIIYAGHTHMDEYRLTGSEDGDFPGVAVLVNPSVSPLFGNNPGYRIAQAQGNGPDIYDYQAHTMFLSADTPAFHEVLRVQGSIRCGFARRPRTERIVRNDA